MLKSFNSLLGRVGPLLGRCQPIPFPCLVRRQQRCHEALHRPLPRHRFVDEVVGRYLGAEPDWDCWFNCVGAKSNVLLCVDARWAVALVQTPQCGFLGI